MTEQAGADPSWERRPLVAGERDAQSATAPRQTFIDSGAIFEGTLRLRQDLCIDSDFRGEIVSEATLIVGESGTVQGDIRAREVVIRGAVVGNVTARRQVTLTASARLHGDIESACVQIEKHAFFNGRTSMTRPDDALRAQGQQKASPVVRHAGSGA